MSDQQPTDEQVQLADLIAAQGAIFIREFLRDFDGLAVSGSKAKLRTRVLKALVDGVITPERAMEWISSIEAWGSQYVQMARRKGGSALPDDFDEAQLRRRLAGTDFQDVVGQLDTTTFPDELTSTGAVFREARVRLTWHVRADREVRTPSMDEERQVDEDEYVFKAYRIVPERHTVRLVIDQASGISAVFVSVPRTSSVDPSPVVRLAWDLDQLIADSPAARLDLDRAIATLAEGTDPTIAAKRRRMAASGAEVSFAAIAATEDYRDSPEVSQVADTAAHTPGMSNRAGRFSHSAAEGPMAPTREIMVSIDEENGHMWVPASVSEEQMWNLVDMVATASRT